MDLLNQNFVVNFENTNLPGQVPSKLIDYAIVGKPILNISPGSPNGKIINEFLNADYTNAFLVEDLDQYHISNVYQKFMDLIK